MRATRLVSGLLGLGLVGLGLVVAEVNSERAADAREDAELRSDAEVQASNVEEYFSRSHAIIRLLAQNPAFRQSSVDPSDDQVRAMQEALAYVETLYPGQISETCAIDRKGHEVARVVGGEHAHESDLSTEEAANPFFAPTLALGPGQVHQAKPYFSPDTSQWVVSNSTMVEGPASVPDLMVHFEVSVASLVPEMQGMGSRTRVVTADGLVVLDTSQPHSVSTTEDEPGWEASADLQQAVDSVSGGTLTMDVDGERAVIRAVPQGLGNDNRWFVVSSIASRDATLRWGDPIPLVLMALGLATLALAWRTHRSHERTLRGLSLSDGLTGLANRMALREHFVHATRAAQRTGDQLAVLLLDLDDFKEVNDTLGHHRGDEMLRLLAERLQGIVCEGDVLARLGGDEFAMLVSSNDAVAAARACVQRIEAALVERFVLAGVPIEVGASIGVAIYPTHGDDIDTLLQRADVAMYRAKRAGAAALQYSSDFDVHSTEQLQLLGELRKALAGDQFELHYQPIVAIDSGEVIGAEALVRWRHPERGLLMPADFIDGLERSVYAHPFARWVIETGLRQLTAWDADRSQLSLSVNLSPKNLTDPDLATDVRLILEHLGIAPHRLTLEVTEGSFLRDPELAVAGIEQLRALGIHVAIDDFGTGYSSLAYLRNLPLTEVKIDRTFVAGLLAGGPDTSIVESTIGLAHALGLRVVAEGIEDVDTLERLRALGCDLAQGYYLGRPVAASSFEQRRAAPQPTAS